MEGDYQVVSSAARPGTQNTKRHFQNHVNCDVRDVPKLPESLPAFILGRGSALHV